LENPNLCSDLGERETTTTMRGKKKETNKDGGRRTKVQKQRKGEGVKSSPPRENLVSYSYPHGEGGHFVESQGLIAKEGRKGTNCLKQEREGGKLPQEMALLLSPEKKGGEWCSRGG